MINLENFSNFFFKEKNIFIVAGDFQSKFGIFQVIIKNDYTINMTSKTQRKQSNPSKNHHQSRFSWKHFRGIPLNLASFFLFLKSWYLQHYRINKDKLESGLIGIHSVQLRKARALRSAKAGSTIFFSLWFFLLRNVYNKLLFIYAHFCLLLTRFFEAIKRWKIPFFLQSSLGLSFQIRSSEPLLFSMEIKRTF